MPRPSKIDRLPPEVREEIGRLRANGRSIDEILAKLRELEADVSRSALGRHVQRLDQLGEKLRRSRAMAEGLARGLGERPADEVTRANIELMHDALFNLLQDAALAEDGEEGEGADIRAMVRNPMGAKLIAEALERLTKASRGNVQFVEQIEQRVAARSKAEAAQAVEKAARARGLSAETAEVIKAAIFGVKG
jgi:hypothetical protein